MCYNARHEHRRNPAADPPAIVRSGKRSPDRDAREEWESLCDGCGQCCLIKVEDEDTATSSSPGWPASCSTPTRAAAATTANRKKRVATASSTPQGHPQPVLAPATCAYRSLAEGRGLEWWHPLVSGDPETVHAAGVSVRGWARSEKGVKASAVARYIIGEAG